MFNKAVLDLSRAAFCAKRAPGVEIFCCCGVANRNNTSFSAGVGRSTAILLKQLKKKLFFGII